MMQVVLNDTIASLMRAKDGWLSFLRSKRDLLSQDTKREKRPCQIKRDADLRKLSNYADSASWKMTI